MLPSDAPKQDWRLYYHNTYMLHDKLGTCLIAVNHNNGTIRLTARPVLHSEGKLGEDTKISASDIKIFWPRPGAYNLVNPKCGVFVGRQPMRHMKRSAAEEYYFLQWGPTCAASIQPLHSIITSTPYKTLETAKKELTQTITAALSIRTCLNLVRNKIEVVYMAEGIGYLDETDVLVPYLHDDSRLPRIKRHLRMVGIQ